MAKKYYAIKKGIGIVTDSWAICQPLVKNTSYAFKGFETLEDALDFLGAESLCDVTKMMNCNKIDDQKIDKELESINETLSFRQNHEKIMNIQNSLKKGYYVVYTDGGCNPNPGGPGALGIVITKNEKEIATYSESYKASTNNRMEIMAAIRALEILPENSDIKIVSDSLYLVNTMNGKYSISKNHDLWKKLKEKIPNHQRVLFTWIKGHSNNQFNEKCDKMATQAMKNPTLSDNGYVL